MESIQIAEIICAGASLISTIVVGARAVLINKNHSTLESADKKNAERIDKVEEKLNDLKADLPLVYVTREDYIRVMNRVEDKLDQIIYGGMSRGKEE